MAISRNSTATGTNDSSSFNITIAGSHIVAFITYSNSKTLSATTLAGISGTILQTGNLTSEGYKVSAVSYVGAFSGVKAVTFSWTGGTPASVRSGFMGYDGSQAVDVSNVSVDTGGTVSATVTAASCWVVGYAGCPTAAGATAPSTGTNNDAYFIAVGTNNGLIRNTVGDSNGTVSTGSQSVTTTPTGGYTFVKILVALSPSSNYPITLNSTSFLLTGNNSIFFKTINYILSVTVNSFSYTGYSLSFILNLYTRVTNRIKHATTVTNRVKHAVSSVTNRVKNITTVTNRPKS